MTLRNTDIEGNTAMGFGARGGGFAVRVEGAVIDSSLTSNWVTGQYSEGGGGASESGTLEIVASTISGNRAVARGGGVSGLNIAVRDSVFRTNTALYGGGIWAQTLTAISSVFDRNAVTMAGGAIYAVRNLKATRLLVSNNQANGNSNFANGGGGGLAAMGDLTLIDSTIVNNTALGRQVRGGGGIWARAAVTIQNSTISGNLTTGAGGGVYAGSDSLDPVEIRHSTISDNTANVGGSGTSDGGGVSAAAAAVMLDHSIIAGNRASALATADLEGAYTSHFSLVGVGAAFLAPLANNGGAELPSGGRLLTHALLPGSPAIGAGEPAFMPGVGGTPEFDQRGAPFTRLAGERIDIGAFEVQAAGGALLADFNLDGVTDGADFLIWQRNVGRTSGATLRHGDATADGDVDGNDLAVWRARAADVLRGEALGARSEDLGAGAASFQRTAVSQEGKGQGGTLSREEAVALAAVREARFAPGRRAKFDRSVARELDAAFAAVGVASLAAGRSGETLTARGDQHTRFDASNGESEEESWSEAALDVVLGGIGA